MQILSGPIIGALAYTVFYDGLLQITSSRLFVLGATIVLLVLVFPHGTGGAAAWWRG